MHSDNRAESSLQEEAAMQPQPVEAPDDVTYPRRPACARLDSTASGDSDDGPASSPFAVAAILRLAPTQQQEASPWTKTKGARTPIILGDAGAPDEDPADDARARPCAAWLQFLLTFLIMPLLAAPLLGLYWCAALVAAVALTCLVVPSLAAARSLYWAVPFIPDVWRRIAASYGWPAACCVRISFEAAHCISLLSRLATLPLRRRLPDFYVVGFPKCGTTSMAAYLKAHPAVLGPAGLPWAHEAIGKETHFLAGVLGRGVGARAAALYRSFFPTLLTGWWRRARWGVRRWLLFDACPTYACLPFAAQRMARLTPRAKLVFMVRNPADAIFSAETMLTGLGVQLGWSLTQPLAGEDGGEGGGGGDPRFQEEESDAQLWRQLEQLGPDDVLPRQLPASFYFRLHSYLQGARYADRLRPFLEHFPHSSIMVVRFEDFVSHTEETVAAVLRFVGADPSHPAYSFAAEPPRMANEYKGVRMDPGVRALLMGEGPCGLGRSVRELEMLLGMEMGWT